MITRRPAGNERKKFRVSGKGVLQALIFLVTFSIKRKSDWGFGGKAPLVCPRMKNDSHECGAVEGKERNVEVI